MAAIEPRADESAKTPSRPTITPAQVVPPQVLPQQPFFSQPELLPIALETGEIGIWSWDVASNRITWSTNIEGIHGLPGGSFDGVPSDFENEIHPEDRATVISAMQETLQTQKPHRVQYRLAPRPGVEERWIETVATVVTAVGTSAQMIGVCRDVTERARTHRELPQVVFADGRPRRISASSIMSSWTRVAV